MDEEIALFEKPVKLCHLAGLYFVGSEVMKDAVIATGSSDEGKC